MPQSPEDPNQHDSPNELVLAEESAVALTLRERVSGAIQDIRQGISDAISTATEEIDDSVWQPILRKLEAFQNWEKEQEVGAARGKLIEFFDSKTYNFVDKWILTYSSIFGPPILEYLAAQTGTPIDESTKKAVDKGFAASFAADTVGNTIAHGSRYWFKISDKLKADCSDPDKKEFVWEVAPLINLAGVAGGMSAADGLSNVRLARLLKMARLARIARLAKQSGAKYSLEDEGARLVGDDFARTIVVIIAALAAMTTAVHFDYTQLSHLIGGTGPLAVIADRIKRHYERGIRVNIANTYTKRFQQEHARIASEFMKDPNLCFVGKEWAKGRNEIQSLGDHVVHLFHIYQELLNPLNIPIEVDENGEQITQFVDRTIMFTDIRGWTDICSKHNQREVEPIWAAYFSAMWPIVNKHGGRFGKLMGDGSLIFFQDQVDKETGEVISASELAVRCAIDLKAHGDEFDEIIRRELPIEDSYEGRHKTGVAFDSGEISVSDPFRKRKGPKGMRSPELGGHAVNATSRLEGLNKVFPEHVVLTNHDEYEHLPEELQVMLSYCGSAYMKGIGDADIWGIPEASPTASGLDERSMLLSVSKDFPDHTAFITESRLAKLPDDLIMKYEILKGVQLEGKDSTEMIYGISRGLSVAQRMSISKEFPDHGHFLHESNLLKLSLEHQLEYDELKEVQLEGMDSAEMIYGQLRVL